MPQCRVGRPPEEIGGNGVGLTAEDLGDMGRLAELAATSSKTNRGEIYLAVALLFRIQNEQLSERERALMREILQRLAHDVEMAIRISLAERLADDPDAPQDLVMLLADDAIEVARPIILRSRKLDDRAILSFLADADVARQTACAQRPHIGEPVTQKLADSEAEAVLVALVRNATARIASDTFERLVEKSRRIATLQEPLARRHDLPATLAERMCQWVSDALKTYLIESRRSDAAAIAAPLDQATKAVLAPPPAEPGEGARKLVEKLAVAGQLKPGFLLRVLQQGQIELFDVAFAKLLDLDAAAFRELFYRRGPRPVALACRAVGIDKCVFPTVFNLSRQARNINYILATEERREIDAIFGTFARSDAAGLMHRMVAA